MGSYLDFHHFESRYTCVVDAPPSEAYRRLKGIRAKALPLTRVLFGARTLPARLLAQETLRLEGGKPLFELLQQQGFVLLNEIPSTEIALGAVGRFWKLNSGFEKISGAREFREFTDPGVAKAVMVWRFEARDGGGTLVTTETAIEVKAPGPRHWFGLYWMLIRAGSGLIRKEIFRAIQRA